jgi:predicted glycogen debranching enzyme
MGNLVRNLPWSEADASRSELLLAREWLVTNGLGGYASGTVSGVLTRRFHGMLVAALSSPLGRTMMLNDIDESVRFSDGTVIQLSGVESAEGGLQLDVARYLKEFRLEMGLPVWRYEVRGVQIEKRVFLMHMQNTTHVNYRIVEGDGVVGLELRPYIQIRPHEGRLDTPFDEPYIMTVVEDRYEISLGHKFVPLRMMIYGEHATFTFDKIETGELIYQKEQTRGYDYKGKLWSPGYFHLNLSKEHDTTLVASTESWETLKALTPGYALKAELERRDQLIAAAPPEAQTGLAAELVLAADQFITTPSGRTEETARAHAVGDEVRTVIAGYHWFTDWGRDTMISLEGLTLATGRHFEAGCILRTFAHYIRDGLIPNMFPEGEKQGLYHTADATLWFFHAFDRYTEATGDRVTLKLVLPKLIEIVDHHISGTRFGIGVDPGDGLLLQGEHGYQLTWMDAKVDDWVVTPRRGKAVEINALWYNALRLLEGWMREEQDEQTANRFAEHAESARASFNNRFWYSDGGYLYDVIDGEQGDDAACRPNQVFAISLRHPVLDRSRWEQVLNVVRERLLTPVGLRSLSRDHPDYKPSYSGDLRSRDAAYHQGTVWGWLIGPFIDAYLKVYPDDRRGARRFIEDFAPHFDEASVGSISEVFDAEPPFIPRGCIAQAWSVAEVLRCWNKTRDEG